MDTPTSSEITRLLVAWSDGDEQALERLAPLAEYELRRLAKHYLRKESVGHTLQTTALINEAYLRLIEWKDLKWENRAHFFGLAAHCDAGMESGAGLALSRTAAACGIGERGGR
jgi:RNA polymerase sigma-70 factor (ECF subfamily)